MSKVLTLDDFAATLTGASGPREVIHLERCTTRMMKHFSIFTRARAATGLHEMRGAAQLLLTHSLAPYDVVEGLRLDGIALKATERNEVVDASIDTNGEPNATAFASHCPSVLYVVVFLCYDVVIHLFTLLCWR